MSERPEPDASDGGRSIDAVIVSLSPGRHDTAFDGRRVSVTVAHRSMPAHWGPLAVPNLTFDLRDACPGVDPEDARAVCIEALLRVVPDVRRVSLVPAALRVVVDTGRHGGAAAEGASVETIGCVESRRALVDALADALRRAGYSSQ